MNPERAALLAVLAAAGLAAGISAAAAFASQEGQPPQQSPADDPEAKSQAEEKARLMERLRREAERMGASMPPPPAPAGEKPAAASPSQPAPTTPGAAQPGPGEKAQPEEAKGPGADPKSGQPADGKGAGRPVSPARQPGAAPATGAPRTAAQPRPAAGASTAAAGQPGSAPANGAAAAVPPPGSSIVDDGTGFLLNLTNETSLGVIVQFYQQELGLQIIATDGGFVDQQVVLMQPVQIPIEKAIPFLTFLLEQKGYTMSKDDRGIYIISPVNQIIVNPGSDPNNTTQIIPTPGLKPSSIQGPVTTLINATRGAAGGVASQPVFLDDLGVIIMTDSPNAIAVVRQFIDQLVEAQKEVRIARYPIVHISAAAARDRVIELLGSGIISRPVGGQPGANPALAAAGVGGSISNIPDRVTLDSSTNALLFRGRPDEGALLQSLIQLVDVPNAMESRWYPIGTRAAETVVDMARRQQLGEVAYFESSDTGTGAAGGVGVTRTRGAVPQAAGQQGAQEVPGAGFVVYPESGGFIYRGTVQQHARVKKLIEDLGPLSEFDDTITYEFIKLKHSKAVDVEQTVSDLLSGQSSAGNRGALLGRNLSSRDRSRQTATERTRDIQRRAAGEEDPAAPGAAVAGDAVSEITDENVFVQADEPNNQIIVKAPRRLQPQIRRLIEKIDLRRPQVFIEAKIVAITTGDDFRLAAEVQQIVGQFALNTNFGLGTLGTGTAGAFTDRKTVGTGLPGITTALIRSQDVPFIITAIERNTDSRIVASPQVLVDDNEEATVESLDQQPTLTTSIGVNNQNNTQSFGGFEPAGPRLTITPQISDGGYLKLNYEIELSSFTGQSNTAGVPPAKQENRVRAESVTVPSDTTIVVGGLTFEQVNTTISGVPLLKDIPWVGQLFKDTRKNNRNITLYVFITPKIMRDPAFADLRLITRKPLSDARIAQEIPPPERERIDVLDTARADTRRKREEQIDKRKDEFEVVDPESPEAKKRGKYPWWLQ